MWECGDITSHWPLLDEGHHTLFALVLGMLLWPLKHVMVFKFTEAVLKGPMTV